MVGTKERVCITRGGDAKYESDGLREQVVYRDLDVREATGGRYHAHIIRTGTGERKVPRHVHKLDLQLSYVLKGWVTFWFEDQGEVTLSAGDSFLIPGGMPHEVHGWSDDIEVLEITSPADYETVDTPAG